MVVLAEALPRSASSLSSFASNYEVFLSFRGEDTRLGFTDHLYRALLDADIKTFRDDEDIKTGESVKPELLRAIESARASIIVLSENYASSTWCLDELALILDQMRNHKQIVMPIFYHVDPSDVRKKQSSFREAMAHHKQRMEKQPDAEKRSQLAQKIELWKRALTEVADLKGKYAYGRKESEVIEEVVNDIYCRLGVPSGDTLPLLIGMDLYIQPITSWLTDGSRHTANILTLVGRGGSGKTSLAKYVFLLNARNFYGSSFVEGINTRCTEHFNGLRDLQRQVLEDVFKKAPLQVNDASVYTSKIEKALARKMVFIVLDDIGSLGQLDALLGTKSFHPGSKIIITTRDGFLTERCALFKSRVQPKHTKVLLKGLSETESLELLCMHAFQSPNPKEGYTEVSQALVKYCEGYPLALERLGKSLQKQTIAYWDECIKSLQKEPHSGVENVLQMSFHPLPFKTDKGLFKHISCFFVGEDRDSTQTLLNTCDINTKSRITNLIDRGLLGAAPNKKLPMHSLIQDMGRDIVCQESRHKPWMPSRVWYHEKKVGLLLGLAHEIKMLQHLSPELKTLELKYVQLSGSYKGIPLDLRMENLCALDLSYSNIESPDMFYSNTQPPAKRRKLVGSCLEDKQLLVSLKVLKLNSDEQLCSLGGISKLPALERLEFISLKKPKALSLENCNFYRTRKPHAKRQKLVGSLKVPKLRFWEQLHSLGWLFELHTLERLECINLKVLKMLSLDGCDSCESPDMFYSKTRPPAMRQKQSDGPLKVLKLSFHELHNLGEIFELRLLQSSDCISLKKLETLSLDGCNSCEPAIMISSINSQSCLSAITWAIPSDLKFLTTSLSSSLRMLSLANNNLFDECFPEDFSCLALLEELCLDENPIVSMPSCVRTLPRLKELSMDNCEMVVSIEYPPCTLRVLSIHSFGISPYKDCNTWLRKITFNPEMSQLNLCGASNLLSLWSCEIDGMLKIQPLAGVDEKLLYILGWTSIDFIKERCLRTYEERCLRTYTSSGSQDSQTQVYYEFGIFSTFIEGKQMPDWIECRSVGPSISFTIPSSPKKLQGLNFCCVETHLDNFFELPMIKISNVTKNHTWVYDHYIDEVRLDGKGSLIYLNHWCLGPNEMTGGDHIIIIVVPKPDEMIEEEEDMLGYHKSWNVSGDHIIAGFGKQLTKECGIGLVYNEDGKFEEDVLGSYKSWNHIIGGDLSRFRLATGEYILHNRTFTRIIN